MSDEEEKRSKSPSSARSLAAAIKPGASGEGEIPPRAPRTRTAENDSAVPRADRVIGLTRTSHAPQPVDALTQAIERSTERLGFENYKPVIDVFMCRGQTTDDSLRARFTKLDALRRLPFPDTDKYRLLKVATEAFITVNAGIVVTDDLEDYLEESPFVTGDPARGGIDILPYLAIIRRKFPELDIKADNENDDQCFGLLQKKLEYPFMIELIWSYWHEEAMLVQTLNAISLRFQNRRNGGRDPLAQLEVDPLRSLSNILWGYIQDEQHRLTVARRAYEYLHHYGITLQGKAVPKLDYAESRSKFIEAFHTLLNITSKFYLQDDDTTVVADGFPVLNALKEVHLLLSQGAHNQYGDLPWTARQEMLMQQWILARPEFREFLPRRAMVAYPEEWMDSVDSMRRLQGWGHTPVLHYNNLALFGEQILLSIRFGNWTEIHIADAGANWARLNRSKIQSYIHDYRAVTGVDLAADRKLADRVDTQMPSVHLVKRLAAEQQAMRS